MPAGSEHSQLKGFLMRKQILHLIDKLGRGAAGGQLTAW
jgi:hypothetical protein